MLEARVIAGDYVEVVGAILNALPDALALLDADGRIELENRPMRELRRAAGGSDALGLTEGAPDLQATSELKLSEGRRVFARRTAPITDAAGDVHGHLVALREITRERDALQLREELFGLVSHELRTPLTAIIGYLDLVFDGRDELTDDQHQFLDVVDRNARRLLRLVDDMLFTAQVEAGRPPPGLEWGRVELAEVLVDALDAAQPGARARGIELARQIDTAPVCRGDRDRLGQVVDNLVANALKFTPEGGRVSVRLTSSNGEATVEVSDSGPGVPVDDQARLFEPFFRSADAIDRAVPGAGLGLSIVKAIVEAHEGRIGVRSDPTGGATFVLALPLDSDEADTRAPGDARASARDGAPDPGPTGPQLASGES
jgi:signal transduction histidine kinase